MARASRAGAPHTPPQAVPHSLRKNFCELRECAAPLREKIRLEANGCLSRSRGPQEGAHPWPPAAGSQYEPAVGRLYCVSTTARTCSSLPYMLYLTYTGSRGAVGERCAGGEQQLMPCRSHGSAATKEVERNRELHRKQAAAPAQLVDEATERSRLPVSVTKV